MPQLGRALDSFPLSATQRSKLAKAGFFNVQDVLEVSVIDLSRELGITTTESLEILTLVRGDGDAAKQSPLASAASVSGVVSSTAALAASPVSTSASAAALLQQEASRGAIRTGSFDMDAMLGGGGVPVGKITEFCGAPGIGKTQLGIQIAVNAHMPRAIGGLEGEAVYIDTEGSFIIERSEDIAEGGVRFAAELVASQLPPQQAIGLGGMTAQQVLAGIHYFRVHDYIEQLALVNILPEFLAEHPAVRVIIVDSVAFHFRHHFDDMALRTRLLNGMAQSFLKMAIDSSVAIVLVNQMTTKMGSERGQSHLVPALGESWGHASTNRVIMFWKDGLRQATLYKSSSMQERTITYQITAEGVRDAPSRNLQPTPLVPATSNSYMAPSKRPREEDSDPLRPATTSPQPEDVGQHVHRAARVVGSFEP
ncbi:RAD51C protein [Capsaspora owczarzaki ATCC 30864]|uniref:DNA repair protein RAD51 homolog 3 n=1 Tax=Capsaspora owczarzaki (strain ATCC 30864) TaxID=595528 RepID=A0A0D2X273_CAPO3|nr:RAD51C protein [Capsaspora owczarzaki ATCC 30864]KJE92059.1 RAD51C protein [Capsaspora owczarzaki ATCC 30864]|eukprot:XP_004363926.1 RAD51C protein [Capsaspora owczarzaki ATCC 30864]